MTSGEPSVVVSYTYEVTSEKRKKINQFVTSLERNALHMNRFDVVYFSWLK